MAFNPNPTLLGKIQGGSEPQGGQTTNYMQSAQAALGNWDRTPQAPGPTVGGALGAGMGGALTMAGAGAAMTAAGATGAAGTMAAGMMGPIGLAVGAGIGILSHIFS